MEPNLAGALSYALWWVTGIVFLVIEKNPEVKFHAWQSIGFFGGITVVRIVLGIIGGLFGSLFLGVIFGLISLALTILALVLWIMLMVRTYQGQRMVLPVVGPWAAQQAGIQV